MVIGLPDVLQVAIQIALFSWLGFLLYEKLGVKVRGKGAVSRVAVRKFARYYLASTFLLFFAYVLAYLRGVPWVAAMFTEITLRDLEGLTGFLGFVALLAPIYPIYRLLSGKEAISKVTMPNLDQMFVGGIMSLAYLTFIWGQQTQIGPHTLFSRLIQLSLLIGVIGMFGVVWLANETRRRQMLKKFLLCLALNPWVSVAVLAIVHAWGWI
jgi:hypothetical protein